VIADTKRFEIQPILDGALSETAIFLDRWGTHRDQGSSVPRPVRADSPSTVRRLWWLLVDNPLAAATSQHGLCIRDASGVMVGLLLSFPSAFRVDDQRLLGLCSGSYFVEPQARTLGFYLFKRHLNHPGYSFFFSTTCNADSGALWKTLGACAPPNSDAEYILPLDLEAVLPAFLAGRTSRAFAARLAQIVGRCANPILHRFARKSAGVFTEPCRDWEKLAALSRRHRPAHWITADRSAAFLQWRYGPNSPNHSSDICVFRDRRGNEGWFCLGDTIRGNRVQIRGRALLDAAWPREKMSFDEVLRAISRFAVPNADAIYFRPRPGLDHGEFSRWTIRRRMDPPPIFAIPGKRGAPLAVSSLDLVPADGDSSFAVSGS